MMRRKIITRVIVFLLAGAIINIAVAWGFAICCDIYSSDLRWVESLGFTYDAAPASSWIEWQAGFPMRGLHCTWKDNIVVEGGCLTVPTPLPDQFAFKGDTALLPTGLLWPGFIFNTIVYAGASWVISSASTAPFAFRRTRRIQRGLCPACAYPSGSSMTCTECGKPVPGNPAAQVP